MNSIRLSALALIFSFSAPLWSQALYVKPVKVLGDPLFVGTAANPTQLEGNGPNVVEGREMSTPLGIALDTSVSPPILYVADSGNNRVLGFQYSSQLTPGAYADVILGQTDRFSNLAGGPATTRSTGLNSPTAVAVDSSGNVYVADTGNNRILRFPKPSLQPNAAEEFPDLFLGQPSFSGRTANNGGISAKTLSLQVTSSGVYRSGLAFDPAGNLWVADTGNNRVLSYPAAALKAGTNNAAATLVIGQNDFISSTPGTTAMSKSALANPQGIAFDTAGRLLVADSLSRVLVYAPAIAANGTLATRILGVDVSGANIQATQIRVFHPLGVTGAGAGVIVADSFNSRVLLFPTVDQWSAESTQFSPSAIAVVGQASYILSQANQGNGDASASSFNIPADVAASASELYVCDWQNSRILVFPLSAGGVTGTATRVVGQLDFPYFAPNLIEGKEFSFGAPSLGTSSALAASAAVLDQSSSPPHLYVADTLNNRILGFKNFSSIQIGLQKADLVIGQPDFYRGMVNYPTNMATMPSQQSLNGPTALAVDSEGNLYVADTGNSRVLRFPAPFASGKTALEAADLVIGQTGFSSSVTDPTAQTMNAPAGLALSSAAANVGGPGNGWLIVSDAADNRVLFFQQPFSNGMSATRVLGSPNFTTVNAGANGSQQFRSPHGVAVDPQDRVLVADSGNNRVQIFNSVGAIINNDTPPTSLTGLTQPLSIGTSPTGFWVASTGNNLLLHYPTVDQLGIKNNASDASLTAFGPLSASVDPFGNLLITDGANRVLYYAPQVGVVSAASYSPRALTAGMFAAVFPSLTTNMISSGTAAAANLPLPTTLSDTQVLVNGTPAPLYYVSPGQINVELSNSLPAGGTATLQVLRPSTSQIYGSEEIPLASADPALFSTNGSGGGQVAAVNFLDASINSSTNPVMRGQTIILYGTGVGPVPNAPPDGQAPSGAVSAPNAPQILLGASATTFVPAANVTYSGLAPLFPGIWQINLTIPADAPTGGSIPIKIFQNNVPSIDPTQTTAAATTIAIK